MARLALSMLGPLQATVDGEPVTTFRSEKVRALLVYLALHPGRPHRREALAGLLWPDQPETTALHNLRQSLVRLRAALGDEDARRPFLLVTPKTVQFNPESDTSSDVAAFSALLTASQQHRHRHRETCHSCAERLAEAAALYRGPFLAGFFVEESDSFDEWLLLERERYHRQALELLADLVRYHERRSDHAIAEEYARRQVGLEPWREEAHRQLMRVLALQGERSAALAQYQTCRRLLAEELGVEPGDETTVLYEQIQAGQLEAPAGARRRGTLAVHLTPLLGRAADVEQVVGCLQDPACRLITLLGPPGIGKTRLALEVATRLQDEFDDGLVFVPLSTIDDPALVAVSIAQALDLRESSDRPLSDSLQAWLRDKELLLVLDNFEHLLAAAPLIGELLARCRRLAVLATSQAALHLQGEQEMAVPPLALPAFKPGMDLDVAALGQAAAVQLFVERARAVKPEFRLEAGNAQAVTQICVRLDGLPLAIELAAVRSKLLPPQAILARLSNRLALLSSGTRDAPARQQTLRAAIGWSYELLEPAEQVLFRRLAVFVGGWTLEAVEAICGGESVPPILDGLAALLDKSLLQQMEPPKGSPDGETRLTMLETIREYALEQLEVSADAQVLRQQHLAYYLQLAEEAEPNFHSAAQRAWLERLEAEHDNQRAALTWSLAHGDPEASLRLAGALVWFWNRRGYMTEGRLWLERALQQGNGSATAARVKVLAWVGALAARHGEHERSHVLFEESLALSQTLGDRSGIGYVFLYWGRTAREQCDFRRATRLEEESLAIFRAEADAWGTGWALMSLGDVALDQGDLSTAAARFEEALALLRRQADLDGTAWALLNLGHIALGVGNAARAAALYQESLAMFRAAAVSSGTPEVLLACGRAAYAQGDAVQAGALYREGLALSQEIGDKDLIAEGLAVLGRLAGVAGQHSEGARRAARLLGAAAALREAIGVPLAPFYRADYEREVAAARARLDEAAFESAWAEGRAMLLEQAIAYALDADP